MPDTFLVILSINDFINAMSLYYLGDFFLVMNNQLVDNTIRIITMTFFVLENNLLAGIGIAVYAEMTARIVHPDVLAYHTAADLALALVFEVFSI